MSREVVIQVDRVSLAFPIVRFRPQGIKDAALTFFRRRKSKPPERTFWALRDVSLTVRKSEVLGIVGANGSGKSTLLKIISGIYRPDKGSISTKGRISTMLELGAGFREELTGYENIRLNGAILGFSPKDMDQRLDEIIHFSGLKDFIDQPLRTYSSGMKVRLGFAVASSIAPDILLIDEVLAVGDEEFKTRSMARIEEMVRGETTVVIVSHNEDELKRLCQRLVLIHKGEMVMDGEPDKVLYRYHEIIWAPEPALPPASAS